MNTIREIDRINQKQLELGDQGSWHDDYKDSAYIFVGGIPYGLTEGDVLCVFSQYGEILDLNMPRDRETGKPKGFAFLKYDDQRSTVLAVDNFNGAQLLGRTLRVDHSRDYRQTKRRKRREGDMEESSEEEELDEEGKPRVKGFNVAPKGWLDPPVEESEPEQEEDLGEGIDIDDPMRDYLIEKRREEKKRQQGTKKIKVEGEEKEHRHRHRSRKGVDEDGDRHRHRHRHGHRIEDGKRGSEEDVDRRQRHRRKEERSERNRREDTTPKISRRDDRTPERGARDDTPPKRHRRDTDLTPVKRDNSRDTAPPRHNH